MTVVGVAADMLNRRLSDPPQPILYRSIEQASDLTMALLIRTGADSAGLAESVAREIRAVDPNLPIYSVRTMNECDRKRRVAAAFPDAAAGGLRRAGHCARASRHLWRDGLLGLAAHP